MKTKFTISGFIVALIVIAMFSSAIAVFIASMEDEYGISGETSIGKYNQTNDILKYTEEIRDATDIEQQEGILDVIGGYFRSGYSALKTALKSFSLFENLMEDASEDIEYFGFFRSYLTAIILILIFVGVIISVLVKMRV